MKKEMLKSKKGITLIALVVTILVLLILAGVSIATLTGDNGIITRANEVKAQTEIAEEREQIELAYISAMGNNMSTEVILKDLQTELKNNGYENIVTSEIDENGNKGLLVNLTKKDRYYFIENGQVRIATKEEFSKEMTAVYAILYSDGDLRFNKTGNTDETKIANGATVLMKSNDISKVYMTAGSSQPWYSYETQIKSVTFEERVAPQYTSYWFCGCSNIETINNIGRLETSNVINMKHMFENLTKITTLDLSTFDTSNVTEMAYMFSEMTSLKKLDISNFNTSKATRMDRMFKNCTNLIKLDLSSFDTLNVTRMDSMFDNCTSLKELDLTSFNTLNVTNMIQMFYNCTSLTKLDLSSFNTSNVTNMQSMFASCFKLEEVILGANFNIKNVTDMRWMFTKCSSITNLDLSSFGKSKVTSMVRVFDGMTNLKSLDISNLDTSNVTDMSELFNECKNLSLLDMRTASFDKVTNYTSIFNFQNSNLEIKVIVNDDKAKTWVQGKLGTGKGTVLTVSELPTEN